MEHLAILLILPVLTIIVIAQDRSPPCYWPDGNQATDNVACNSTETGESACCDSKSQCTTAGYCLNPLDPPGWLTPVYRGSCTDRRWNSAICPRHCAGQNATNGSRVNQCPTSNHTDSR